MTKEKYMALADFQTLWDDKLKPWINGQKADKTDVAALASAIGYTQEFVDLGLPSGTLWAKCNIGSTEETDYGKYYKYGLGATQYDNRQDDYTGTEDPLDAQYDTATQVMGSPWHMPTKEQMQELIDNTTYSWETNFKGSGINGGKFTAANGNYVFFPAAGYYYNGSKSSENTACGNWASSPAQQNGQAIFLYANANNKGFGSDVYKSGRSVRGVMDSNPYDITKKADKTNTYTKTEVDNKLLTKSNISHNHDSSYSALGHTHDDRYYTEAEVDSKLSGKANTSHTHDDRYYQKSQVYQKSETYTKKETEGYVQSKFGLKYDAENRAVIVPVASVATYQKSKRMIDFTGIAY